MLVASVVVALGALVRRIRVGRGRGSERKRTAGVRAAGHADRLRRGVAALAGLITVGAGAALFAVAFC
ncbi:hypothetical protein [Nocardia sp. CA-290969]|uniref:hypothetical protein n=1 Tax=Nocardia sp. CA-290969 TaxID=3239986 RepID=UPI003D8FB302